MDHGASGQCAILAERHLGLSDAMRGLLQPLFGVIVMVADESSLREALARLRPQVVVLDIGLEPGNGLRLIAQLHADFPATRIVSIGGGDGASAARAVLAAGATAFVPTRSLATNLVGAVEAALASRT